MALPSPQSEDDLLTKAEAAKLLRVSPVTISRWLKQGRLPAYRLGPRAVRIRRADVQALLRPAFGPEVAPEPMQTSAAPYEHDPSVIDHELIASIKPLTEEEREEALAAMRAARELRERILTRRGERPLPPSWPLIRQAREER